MNIDVVGRVRNTKLAARRALMPLFEAIANSISAIAERAGRTDGMIEITIRRDLSQTELDVHGNTIAPVDAFEVSDNGIGFTDENFSSFETMDSRVKAFRGAKGIGRLLWLKAFDRAEIESVYQDIGTWRRRRFEFRLTPNGIEGHTLEDLTSTSGDLRQRTVVRLVGFKPQFREHSPKAADTIARRIVEHCMEYFLLGSSPKIVVSDPDNSTRCDLSELFDREYHPQAGSRDFEVGDVRLSITDVLIKASADAQHRVHFCAHNRVVESVLLAGRIAHLDRPLVNEQGDSVVYEGYVIGDFLNDHVDAERTSFNVSREGEFAFEEGPSWDALLDGAVASISQYLAPRTEELRQRALDRIRTFVDTREPRYRPLLAHRREEVERISGSISDAGLDLELHKILNGWREEVRSDVTASLERISAEPSNFAMHRDEFRRVLGELQEVAKSDLAEYVVHRATVLSFFEKLLGRTDGENFAREDAIHGLFFPQRKTSSEVDYDEHSLWLIDERLAYHRYLASDVPLRQQSGPLSVESDDRPDVVIFNNPLAFAPGHEPFASVVVIEFKRPERADVTDEKSPIRQVLRYVRLLREGKARRPDGSTIDPPRHVPFYCYVVATLTDQLRAEAQEMGFVEAPDARGYFSFNSNFNAYIEVSSYRKVLDDARKRNQAFFDRLQIQTA